MDTHTTKPKNLTFESSSQPQDSKKSSSKNATPKIMPSKTAKVHKVRKNTKATTTATTQTDKKLKQKLKEKAPSKKDTIKTNTMKKEASATTTATTKPTCKSKGSSSASASASVSASTSDPDKKKKASTKEKQEATGTEKAEDIKSQKRPASEVDNTDVTNESEPEGQLGLHRPTKTRRIQKEKAEADARSTFKRKKAARNNAIWKMITNRPVAFSDSPTTTTMITTNKEAETVGESTITVNIIDTITTGTVASVMEVAPAAAGPAVAAVSGVDSRVVDKVRDTVDQSSIHEGDSENTTGGIAEMNASGDQNPDAPTATAAAPPTSPRRKTLDALNDAALEKLWALARGKFD